MENNRVVIDTNVFISAIIGQFSYPFKIFEELVFTGEVVVCLSPALLREYAEIVQRPKFRAIPHFAERANQLLNALQAIALVVTPEIQISLIADEADNRVLELAVTAQARVIVTGNTRDFNFPEFRGVVVQTPKEFYEEFYAASY